MSRWRYILRITLAIFAAALAVVIVILFIGWPRPTPALEPGVTFSRRYAEDLGLEADKALAIALDEIGIRRFRIPAYWGILEHEPGRWDFSYLDRDIEEIGKRGGKVILAMGEKLPRWPECWGPRWWKKLPRGEQRAYTLKYLEAVVTRYRNNPAVAAWQVENEPHFQYGDCGEPDYAFILRETEFVRGLDPSREVYITDSGELSTWLTLGVFADRLGVSVYRVVRNPWLGDLNIHYWLLPPYFYKRKAALLRPFGVKDIYISEFQMEPWSNTVIQATPLEDQLSSMNLEQMRSNFYFAERMGIKEVDFWGLEWWIWMREKSNHPEFLDEAGHFWSKYRS